MMKLFMLKQKLKNTKITSHKTAKITVLVGAVFVMSLAGGALVSSQSLQEQINNLRSQNNQKQEAQYQLSQEATDLNDKVSKLQAQIDSLQGKINDNQNRSQDLHQQIETAEAELAKQKKVLGDNIRQMYLEGQISTLEMLASSKNISEFVDKQQYRNAVKDKIKTTLDKITELKHQLRGQRDEVEKLLAEQKLAQNELGGQRGEQNRLLAMNADQRSQLDGEIKQNAGRIAELQRQQVLENAKLFGGKVPSGVAGGGGYPWGNAQCLHAGYPDTQCPNYDWGYPGYGMWDTWGYGYRNCTSWVAYKVAASGRHMPSGLGHAKNWIGNAQARGYSVSYGEGAQVGDAAVNPNGFYGHVMYVEAVEGNTVYVSDYNAGGDGYYRGPRPVSASGLVFIHF